MYELISNLILYGNLPEDEILVQLANGKLPGFPAG